MPRVRALEGKEAGLLTRFVQTVFRFALGRELNPYKVEAHAPRTVLSSFLSNSVMTTGRWMLGGDLRHLVRVRVAARNGCPF
jgi:alkylhydroperoxidase family enzyme